MLNLNSINSWRMSIQRLIQVMHFRCCCLLQLERRMSSAELFCHVVDAVKTTPVNLCFILFENNGSSSKKHDGTFSCNSLPFYR